MLAERDSLIQENIRQPLRITGDYVISISILELFKTPYR
jgi:hypothetical protein